MRVLVMHSRMCVCLCSLVSRSTLHYIHDIPWSAITERTKKPAYMLLTDSMSCRKIQITLRDRSMKLAVGFCVIIHIVGTVVDSDWNVRMW